MKVCVLPYEDLYDFRVGSSLGWFALKLGLESIEEYSFWQNKKFEYSEIEEVIISLPLNLKGEKWVEVVWDKVKDIENINVFVGGNHLISYIGVKYFSRKYPDLKIVHLDAHLDRRDIYEGNKWNYATVFRRIEQDIISCDKIFTFGWRSKCLEENYFYEGKIFSFDFEYIRKIDYPIYLSLDFDFFDPSFFDCVSNPEPGGFYFRDFLKILDYLKGKLVGFDIVEYNPLSGSSSCMAKAAVIFREIFLLLKNSGYE